MCLYHLHLVKLSACLGLVLWFVFLFVFLSSTIFCQLPFELLKYFSVLSNIKPLIGWVCFTLLAFLSLYAHRPMLHTHWSGQGRARQLGKKEGLSLKCGSSKSFARGIEESRAFWFFNCVLWHTTRKRHIALPEHRFAWRFRNGFSPPGVSSRGNWPGTSSL